MIHIIMLIMSMTLGFYLGALVFTMSGGWGPFGAALGAFAGYLVYYNLLDRDSFSERLNRFRSGDRRNTRRGPSPWRRMFGMGGRDPFLDSSLPGVIVALVALAAKMAKADGRVSANEIRAFRRVVDITDEQEAEVARIWGRAKTTASNFEPYAQYLKNQVGDPGLLAHILDCLVTVAHADRNFSAPERQFLESVARIFGLQVDNRERDTERHDRTRRTAKKFTRPPPQSPYHVLGLAVDASKRQIKKAYRDLARKHHPDYLTAQGLSQEMVDRAHEQMVKINAAYEQIRKERGFR